MFQTILRTLRLLKTNKKRVVLLSVANLFFGLLVLVEPIFFKEVIDILISFSDASNANYSILAQTLVLWIFVGLITISLRLYVSIFSDRLAQMHFDKSIFTFFNHMLSLSMRFHMDSNSGQLVKKITKGVDGIFQIQLDFFRRALPNIIIIFSLIPLVLYFNIKLGLFLIITGIISCIITLYLARKTFTKQGAIESIYSDMSSHYGDTFSNLSVVKSFSLNALKVNELKNKTDLRLKKQMPIVTWWGAIISIFSLLKIVISIGIIFFGSYLFVLGEISIGEIVMFLSFSTIFLSSIEDLTWTLEGLFWRLAGVKDYFVVIDTEVEIQDKKGAKELKDIQGRVEFKNVDFSYDGKRTILSDISINIKAGEKVAFVGHTGSGKTTMTNLLLRFFDIQKGNITIDGESIYEITQESLRNNIGIVFQDNPLFNASIYENIKLDNSNATKQDIERVIEKSHALEFISRLTDGIDTIVGERGVKLSGGEKQRLAIARAFLKDAPILVLDEATSALDAETERYLQGSFDELMKGRTTFIIAHRLSTIMKADRIFVFDSGRIVEEGSYQELVSKKGKFSRLVNAQRNGFVE